jgi:hypothetical protein
MTPRRRFLYLAAGAVALRAASRIAWTQAYPTPPVRIIAPAAPECGYCTTPPRELAPRSHFQAAWCSVLETRAAARRYPWKT